ncbi:type VII secretion protein EccE [Micromonospora sp. NPDC092111]|uniref:type VII secretion protein EccE n=1 Tax=Micromonospora sp. NPDC092111 TaxID=3364289 RepID=UPI0038126051
MTGAPRPARAALRPDDPDARLHLAPRRRPGRIGELHVLQLLLLEAVLLGVLASGLFGMPVLVVVAGCGVLLLTVVFLRSRGRWWLEKRALARHHRRRAAATVPVAADPGLDALQRLAPGLSVGNVAMADGAQIGVARDDAGWFAVAAVGASGPTGDAPASLPLDVLAAALTESGQQGTVLQVVTTTVPAGGPGDDPAAPARESYRQLLAGFGGTPVPAGHATWVAVRLDARSLAEAVGDYAVDLGIAPSVVAALARQVGKSLRRSGVDHRLLDAHELLAAVGRSCGFAPGGPEQSREEWSAWHCGPLAHRSFWIRRWPPVDRAAAMLGWLETVPASMVTVSLTLASNGPGEDLDLRGLVRVTGPAELLPQLCGPAVDGVRQAGGELFPLDGEHGPAVYASAPTGGGAG